MSTETPANSSEIPVAMEIGHKETGGKKEKRAKRTKTDRAGTLFPVGRIQRILRNAAITPRVRSESAVALAGITDDIFFHYMSDMLECARVNKRRRLTASDAFFACELDGTFKAVYGKSSFPRSRRIPHIHQALLGRSATSTAPAA